MNIGTASLQRIVELAVPVAFVVSLALLWLYMRAVRHSMRRTAAGKPEAPIEAAVEPTIFAAGGDAAPPARALEISYAAAPDAASVRLAWRGPWRAGAVQVAGGIAYAVVMALAWWSMTGMPPQWSAIGVIAAMFSWPLVIVIGLVATVSWRAMAVVASVYAAIVCAAVGAMTLVSDLQAWFAATVWFNANALATALVLGFLLRPIRAMGPLVSALMVAAASGVFWMNGLMDDPAVIQQIAEIATSLGFHGYTGGLIVAYGMYALPALVAGYICYFVLRGLGRLYRTQWVSDQSIQIDAVWLTFALAHGMSSLPVGGLAAFVAYKAVTWLGYRLVRPAPAADATAPRLLLLRVFSLGARSSRLFDGFARLWRHIGSIRMIAGPDLANATIEPHEFLDFLARRLQRRFIAGPADLDRRLAEGASRRDPDGRYRVASFFCHADTWQMVLRRLARQSDVVLMDLRGFTRSNKGCVFELNELIDRVRLRQFLLIVDDTTDTSFLAIALTEGWSRIGPASPNRLDPAPRVQLFRLQRAGARSIATLVGTLTASLGRSPAGSGP